MPRRRTSRFYEPDAAAPPGRCCEWPDCVETAQYRAPRSREALREYRWFCLEHIRTYNAKWDYFAGMSPEEIEAHIRADTTWRRPTWRLGSRPTATAESEAWSRLRDVFGLFEDGDIPGNARDPRSGTSAGQLTAAERQAISVLEIPWPSTLEALKRRYKVLVKKHHPDANGGDKASEERLKEIIQAYSTLRQSLDAQG